MAWWAWAFHGLRPLAALANGISSLAPELSNLTATAVLAWYAWYTATRTMPHIVRAFHDEMTVARQDFRAESASLREELSREREYRHADNLAITRALTRLSRATARLDTRLGLRHVEQEHTE